jgi:methyltransferase
MTEYLAVASLLLAVGLARFGEYRLHSRNYGYLTVSGAEELIPQTMRRYYLMHLLIVPAAVVEWQVLAHNQLDLLTYFGGCALLMVGFLLKLWAIKTLGRQWTMRCLFVQGAPMITAGPYRIFKHPEYLARFLETLGLLILLNCKVVTAIYLVYAARLSFEMMRVETRQLREFTGVEDPYPLVEN